MAYSDGILSTLQLGVRAMNDLRLAITAIFPQTGGTATSATGGAATLPPNPVGFIVVTLPDGTSAKVPYYS
ncbi:hypothetical protein FHT87_005154 [Rhizobium sp. BK316]|uniref:hypothetical protein n=1 Tax=Rhizobium sp. BK316 TaxID=2587053 RepID=UPI0016114159|nr:hypothetical protein [Rhizobium sp. BK316]MBB3411201.1 hypothetical protein [Rhizobium sp. BK316]